MERINKYIKFSGLASVILLIHLFCYNGIIGQFADLMNPVDTISLVKSQDGFKTIPFVSFTKGKEIQRASNLIVNYYQILEQKIKAISSLFDTAFQCSNELYNDFKPIIKVNSEGIYLPKSLEFLVHI